MQATQSSLFARPDTFFGVCEGIGEDLGFNPLLLRLALTLLLFFNPVAALASYAALAVTVLAARLLFPKPIASTAVAAPSIAQPEPAMDHEPERLAA